MRLKLQNVAVHSVTNNTFDSREQVVLTTESAQGKSIVRLIKTEPAKVAVAVQAFHLIATTRFLEKLPHLDAP